MAEKSRSKSRPDTAARRRAAFRKARGHEAIQAYLITRPEDVGYLTGFAGEDSYLVFSDKFACLITDGRYEEQAGRECPEIDIHVRRRAMSAAVAEVLVGRGVRRLGVQADHMTLRAGETLRNAAKGVRLAALPDVLGALRATKDDTEVAAIRRAVRIAEQAMRDLIADGAKGLIGRTERDVAADLDYRMRLAGAEGSSFETIVAVGANASLPHYRPGDDRIEPGAAVLFDWGARRDGYVSDLTRVVFISRIPPKLAKPYAVTARAQKAGIAAIRSGVGLATADAAARKVIEQAGYGDRFLHSLGHGIGRMIHEGPALSRRSKGRLRRGMVVTVEPGIYLPGIGGIRIEDDVLVTTKGRRRLSSLPRDPRSWTLR